MLSSSTGTFLGSGIVLTQRDNLVQVRNPPRPPVKENEVTVTVDTETSTTDELISESRVTTRRGGGWGRVMKRRRMRARSAAALAGSGRGRRTRPGVEEAVEPDGKDRERTGASPRSSPKAPTPPSSDDAIAGETRR